jgi:hypothetical protein
VPKPRADDYFVCESCGAELPLTATFCRHCGASDECGWGENQQREEFGLPGGYDDEQDDFDYDEFVAREFPDQGTAGATGAAQTASPFRVAVVLVICISLLASVVFYVFR